MPSVVSSRALLILITCLGSNSPREHNAVNNILWLFVLPQRRVDVDRRMTCSLSCYMLSWKIHLKVLLSHNRSDETRRVAAAESLDDCLGSTQQSHHKSYNLMSAHCLLAGTGNVDDVSSLHVPRVLSRSHAIITHPCCACWASPSTKCKQTYSFARKR